MRVHMCVAIVLAIGLSLGADVPFSRADREVEQVEEKHFDLEPGSTVKITSNEGYVRVVTGDRSGVSLTMTRHARGKNKQEAQRRLDEIEINIDEGRDRLIIRERDRTDHSYSIFDLLDPDTWNEFSGRRMWVDFDLTVPRETHLVIETDEGDISVAGVKGNIDTYSDEGEIELLHIISDRLVVATDEGDIILEDIEVQSTFAASRLDIDSDEGEIELADVQAGRIKIETDEGDVVADRLRCERLDFYSDEGGIDALLEILETGDYRCRTGEGNVILTLSPDAAFDITARTEEGAIRSDFRLDVRKMDDGERADDTINGGGADLYLFTDEGDIRLRKR